MTKEPEPGPEARDKDDGRRADSSAPSNGPRERAHCGRSHPQLVPNLTRSQSPPPPSPRPRTRLRFPKSLLKRARVKRGPGRKRMGRVGRRVMGGWRWNPGRRDISRAGRPRSRSRGWSSRGRGGARRAQKCPCLGGRRGEGDVGQRVAHREYVPSRSCFPPGSTRPTSSSSPHGPAAHLRERRRRVSIG